MLMQVQMFVWRRDASPPGFSCTSWTNYMPQSEPGSDEGERLRMAYWGLTLMQSSQRTLTDDQWTMAAAIFMF